MSLRAEQEGFKEANCGVNEFRSAGTIHILDFKLPPCFKCCMLSSGKFPGV
jgi:hypothetical protein